LSMTSIRPSISAAESGSRLSRAKGAALPGYAKDLPLSLLCLLLGPLVYAASLATVAAMLVLTSVALIASRHDGVPIIAKSVRALAVVAPLLAWMLASAAWSLDGAASVDVAL